MTKQLTPAAEAAKMIRQNLKKQGLDVKVTSKNYSMGCSVTIRMMDQRPELKQLVDQYCGNFQSGHFDGMTDCYHYSNRNTNLPQAKHIFVNNDMSDEMTNAVYQHIRSNWSGGEALPETYLEGHNMSFQGEWVSQLVWREFCRADSFFWQSRTRKAA